MMCSICACLVLSVSSSSWCLRRAAACDCGTPWTFLLPFFVIKIALHYTIVKYGETFPITTRHKHQLYQITSEQNVP